MPLPDPEEPAVDRAAIEHWECQLDELDYYALLGVTESATALEVERAYHRFALRFHPDGYPGCEPNVRQALTRIFQRGVEARQVLSDPRCNARYRQLRRQGKNRLVEPTTVVLIDLGQQLPQLHEACRSAGAKLEAMNAARAWQKHDLTTSRRRLIAALGFDGNANPSIQACLDVLDDLMEK